MERKTGIANQILSMIIKADEERPKLQKPLQSKVSYTDLHETRPLEDMPEEREKLLKLKTEEKVKQSELREVSKKLKEMPKPVRDAVLDEEIDYKDVKPRSEVGIPEHLAQPLVEELKKEKKIKEDYERGELEADKSILKGELKAKEMKFDVSVDEKRLKKYEELWKQILPIVLVFS
jgi:hypothetical protein